MGLWLVVGSWGVDGKRDGATTGGGGQEAGITGPLSLEIVVVVVAPVRSAVVLTVVPGSGGGGLPSSLSISAAIVLA